MSRDRQYELYVTFGSPSVIPWDWKVWLEVADELDSIISSINGKPNTYSRQFKRIGKRLQNVSFGRMTWGKKSHDRWTHRSPQTGDLSDAWFFCDTQVWVPGRAVCEREKKRPDIYFQVLNGAIGVETRNLKFGSVVALGIATDLPEEAKSAARSSALNVSRIIDAKLKVFKIRPWSLPFGPFVKDSLCDLDTWLFRIGSRHEEEPSLDLLREEWQLASTV